MAKTIWIMDTTHSKLLRLKEEMNFKTFDALLNHLALTSSIDEYPVATPSNILADSTPSLICGSSGSGKTTMIKEVLKVWQDSVLVLDVSNEYPELEKVKDLREVDWVKGGRLRIVTDPDESYSRLEAGYLFRDFNRVKSREEFRDPLKKWLLVVEEGHRFLADENLEVMVQESRKFCKLLVASSKVDRWKGLAPIFRLEAQTNKMTKQ